MASPIQSIATSRIAGVHPDVPIELPTDILFLHNAFPAMTLAGVLQLLHSHIIGLSPANEKGQHFVVTGLRTWQAYEAARVRSIIHLDTIPARILHQAVTPQQTADMARVDLYLGLELYALSPDFTQHQLDQLRQSISGEAWFEVYGRIKPNITSPKSAQKPATRRRYRSAQSAPVVAGKDSAENKDAPSFPPQVTEAIPETSAPGLEEPSDSAQNMGRTESR